MDHAVAFHRIQEDRKDLDSDYHDCMNPNIRGYLTTNLLCN